MNGPGADRDALEGGISLYVHVPFCKTKCPYCDFNTYQGIEHLIAPYMESLEMEIRLWGETLGHPRVNTVFFGGGTPSYVPLERMNGLLRTVAAAFDVAPQAETTLEANPGDLDGAKLARLLEMGVNRLSMGVQSLDDSLLSMLGRRHSAKDAMDACNLARNVGFRSVNLDLMYGLPHQTLAQWEGTLYRALELGAPHLSLYCLTLEEGTPMEQWVRRGKLPQPDPDLAADMYSMARESLEGVGYHHYEISNWAMPGHECQHNITYWRNRPYLGVGPGAHSHISGHRLWDVAPPREYMRLVRAWASRAEGHAAGLDWDSLGHGGPVGGIEVIGRELEMAETMFLGLRLLDGLSLGDFRSRFGSDPLQVYGPQVRELEEQGLLEHSDGVLRLTARGCLLANQVFMRFLG